MRLRVRHVGGTLAAGLAFMAAGCGLDTNVPAPVSGKVYYKGSPLVHGLIVFTPDDSRGSHGPMARASIQADGSYELRTEANRAGATPGWYRVTVVAVETPPVAASAGERAVPRTLLPEKYRDPDLSGLACEVRAGQENSINFNLE
jgi:hypothetical protein